MQILIKLIRKPGSLVLGSIYFSIANLLVTALVVWVFVIFRSETTVVDPLDLLFEGGLVAISFALFTIVSALKVDIHIKAPLMLGCFVTQLGRSLDALDEIIVLPMAHWSAVGDTLTFFGELLVVYGVVLWIRSTYKLSMTDQLTNLYNRHYLDKAFEYASKSRREKDSKGLQLIMLDIDNFKRINDSYGHSIGDEILQSLAKILVNNTRPYDVVARQGGEEFEILLPECKLDTAIQIAERIRKQIENYDNIKHPRFTASLGVAEYSKGDTIKSLRQRADIAVYQAKAEGRNKVIFNERNVELEQMIDRAMHDSA
jgi:diguanylate cyclase (GGDEF)-like protein